MSQVNFVQQINLFMEYSRRNRLTSYDRILWIGLFYCANMWAMKAENHEWPDDYFQVSNSELNDWAGLEERAVRNSRNRLKQMGLIDFRKGDGRRSDPQYRINYLAINGYRIVPVDVRDNGTIRRNNAPDYAGDSVGDHVGDHVGDTVPDEAPEQREIGGKNAPGYAGELRNSLNNTREKYINAKRGGESKRTTRLTARENADVARARSKSIGLVDLENGYPSRGGLLFPLDERGERP